MRAVDGLGLVCMMCNQLSRRLEDLVAGTVVVHEKLIEDVRPSWNTSDQAASAFPGLTQVSPEELILIETYLLRRWDLDNYVRMNTGNQNAERIKAKTGHQPEPGQHGDDFLEEAAKKIRDSSQLKKILFIVARRLCKLFRHRHAFAAIHCQTCSVESHYFLQKFLN